MNRFQTKIHTGKRKVFSSVSVVNLYLSHSQVYKCTKWRRLRIFEEAVHV